MDARSRPLEDLQHIKKMMERSSRFISLSGLSGVSAGICALIGAWVAWLTLYQYNQQHNILYTGDHGRYIYRDSLSVLTTDLLTIGLLTFGGAFITSFLFTWLRSRKNNARLWGATTFRLFWNMVIPLAAGTLFLLKCMDLGYYELIAPGCLIFYGLALVNASKYTLAEVRFLGYCEILLGSVNLWLPGYSIYFWAVGFGILHIFYGLFMWFKYERKSGTGESTSSI